MGKIYFLVFFLSISSAIISCTNSEKSTVYTLNLDGGLQYVPDEKGNIIPDFSYSGYKKNNEVIPHIDTVITIQPIDGDNTQHIQNAVNELAKRPLGSNGFRGAILLGRGTYPVSGQIVIRESGIVLRGTGQEENDTVIVATGIDNRSLIQIKGNLHLDKNTDAKQKLSDAYIPVGTRLLNVNDASAFWEGQQVIIFRLGTKEWIADIGMDKLPDRRDGRTVHQWDPEKYNFSYEREITKIEGNRIFIDIPIVQMMENKYGGGYIYPVTATGRIEHIGIENILLVSEYKAGQIDSDEEHSWTAIEISDTENAWVSDVTARHFSYSLVSVMRDSRFITIRDSTNLDPASYIRGGRRYSFNLVGSQTLFLRCKARNGRHDFVTSSRVTGPNAFVHCSAENTHSDIGPHHRWATGTLYDNVKGGEINVQDRRSFGSGHGWAGAQQVLWNTEASIQTAVQSPPGAVNWSIGHVGKRWRGRWKRDQGIWISEGKHVQPESLFEKQLSERIGIVNAKKILGRTVEKK